MTDPPTAVSEGWLVDTHAHLYACHAVRPFLNSAITNLAQAARSASMPSAPGCLLMAETAADRSYSRLLAGDTAPEGYAVQRTAEAGSIVVRRVADGAVLVLVGGRQYATREGLEVLAYGEGSDVAQDGAGVESMLDRLSSAGALAIVPWGFGKWWLGRGRLVERLVRERSAVLALGDNGNRPRASPEPSQFGVARRHGVPVLAGSDPLPLPSHGTRAGSYGVVLGCTPDLTRPGAQIATLLAQRPVVAPQFGARLGLPGFVAGQIGLRIGRKTGAR